MASLVLQISDSLIGPLPDISFAASHAFSLTLPSLSLDVVEWVKGTRDQRIYLNFNGILSCQCLIHNGAWLWSCLIICSPVLLIGLIPLQLGNCCLCPNSRGSHLN